jgi:hypothetical protein
MLSATSSSPKLSALTDSSPTLQGEPHGAVRTQEGVEVEQRSGADQGGGTRGRTRAPWRGAAGAPGRGRGRGRGGRGIARRAATAETACPMIQCDDGRRRWAEERRYASGRRERRAGGVWPCGWWLDGPSKFKRAVDGLPALLMSFGVGGPLL